MTRQRGSALVTAAAILCLLIGAFGANAAADDNGKVQLSVGGRGFTANPVGPLLDTSGLAPGTSAAATLGVRSRFAVATELSVRLTHVHDDDNGCNPAEAAVDSTCGAGQGDLGHAAVATLEVATAERGSYRPVWRGAAERLVGGVAAGLTVPGHADRWLRLTVAVPPQVGNVIESDTFTFGLRVVLAGNGASGGSGVGGVDTGGHSGNGTGGLAATGFSTVLFVSGGALLLLAGAMLLGAGRSDRRRRVRR